MARIFDISCPLASHTAVWPWDVPAKRVQTLRIVDGDASPVRTVLRELSEQVLGSGFWAI